MKFVCTSASLDSILMLLLLFEAAIQALKNLNVTVSKTSGSLFLFLTSIQQLKNLSYFLLFENVFAPKLFFEIILFHLVNFILNSQNQFVGIHNTPIYYQIWTKRKPNISSDNILPLGVGANNFFRTRQCLSFPR